MKKFFLTTTFIILGLALLPQFSNAQTCNNSLACGCMGACGGDNISISYTATAAGAYEISHSNSLCGSRGLNIVVKVNGRTRYHRMVGQDTVIPSIQAQAGDVISVNVTAGPVDPNIVCIWMGEANVCICQ